MPPRMRTENRGYIITYRRLKRIGGNIGKIRGYRIETGEQENREQENTKKAPSMRGGKSNE